MIEVGYVLKYLATPMLFVKMPEGMERNIMDSEPKIKDSILESLTVFHELCKTLLLKNNILSCLPVQDEDADQEIYYGQSYQTYKDGGKGHT